MRSRGLPLLLFFVIFISPGTSHCQLNKYVQKYNNVSISQQSLKKLTKYNYLIDYYSKLTFFKPKHRVNPDFIRALILAESNADPYAISSKNALGLGQIILSTGRQAGKELYKYRANFRYVNHSTLKNIGKKDLFDPATNILLTCYLISKYNHKFDGKLELVISAWNAGENIKELRRGKHAPYKETLNLIGKVNGYYLYLLKRKQKRLAYKR